MKCPLHWESYDNTIWWIKNATIQGCIIKEDGDYQLQHQNLQVLVLHLNLGWVTWYWIMSSVRSIAFLCKDLYFENYLSDLMFSRRSETSWKYEINFCNKIIKSLYVINVLIMIKLDPDLGLIKSYLRQINTLMVW